MLKYILNIFFKKDLSLSERMKTYAIKNHKRVNHKYDKNKSYKVHLKMVNAIAQKFIHLICEKERENVLAACWGHDLIEDARLTYNDIKKIFGRTVAELIYSCTNEKGKIRKERANNKYYEGIRQIKNASFVKMCDRIANVQYSISNKSSMYDKYMEEQTHFIQQLGLSKDNEMVIYLNELFNNTNLIEVYYERYIF